MVIQSLQRQLDLEANRQVPKGKIENIHENGRKYAQIIKVPFQNLMLDKQILRIENKPIEHKLFLPQEVVRREVWTNGFQEGTIINDNLHGDR